MTFAQIKADIYRRCGFASSPPSDVATRIAAFINETHQELLNEPGMEFLQNDSTTFTSVASQAQYGLAPSVAKIKILRETTNRIILLPMSLGEYRERYPDPSTVTGTPTRWVDLGFDAISVEPSDASTIYVVSSSASDVGTAYIEGMRSGGFPFTASIAMTGATAVAFTAPTDILNITKFYLSAAAVGTVTLREDSGAGTTLATISIGGTYSRYRRIALAPTPSAVITYTFEFERNFTDLVNDDDEPLIPPAFHNLLSLGGRMKEYEKTSDSRWTLARSEYDKALKKLKFWLYEQAVGTPNLRGMALARPSIMDGGSIPSTSSSTAAPLAVTAGGTGFASYAIGDLLVADTTTTLAKLSDVAVGKVLRSGGVGVIPAYGQVVLTTDVTGTLPVANGGTGIATLSTNRIPYGNGTSAFQSSAGLTFDGTTLVANAGSITNSLAANAITSNTTLNVTGTSTVASVIASGLLDISGAAAGQIKFPAAQNASSNVNTLDDYEEGTWTPSIGGSGGQSGQAYSVQDGTYTKVGKLVVAHCRVTLSTLGTVTATVQVQGLPFTSATVANAQHAGTVGFFTAMTNSFVWITGFMNSASTAMNLFGLTAAATGATALAQGDLSNTTSFMITIVYQAAN